MLAEHLLLMYVVKVSVVMQFDLVTLVTLFVFLGFFVDSSVHFFYPIFTLFLHFLISEAFTKMQLRHVYTNTSLIPFKIHKVGFRR